MVKPVVKKVMMGVPAVALSAALACTMAGCGGTEGGQGGSGDGTAATQAAYQSQSIDVEGFTVESLADGTYYRGDVYKADGFWLRVKITNNNDKAMKRFSFITTGAPGGYEAGEVGHVHPEFGADLVGDLLHGFEVFDARVGAPSADDHGGMGFERTLADDFRVDAEGFGIHAVGFGVVEAAGEVDFHAMGEVAAVVEGEAEDRVAGFDERLVDGCVGLCAGVRLYVGVFGAE